VKAVVVPVDGSEASERAIPVASALARRTGCDVVVLLVSASAALDVGDDVEYLERVVDRFPTSVSCRAVVDDRDDSVARVIVDEASSVPDAVIVMATHGRSSGRELVLGSVASGVLRETAVPVVLVGPHCGRAMDLRGQIIVAVDGSDRDEVLIEAAARWAASTSALAVAVHVVPPGSELDTARGSGDEVARDAADALRRRGCVATEATVVAPNGAAGIVRYATDRLATAVLVGHHRRGRVGRFLLGSQALEIVRQARCPVAVIPD
jgi:nucleotide-binding universal stress UspA family protein